MCRVGWDSSYCQYAGGQLFPDLHDNKFVTHFLTHQVYGVYMILELALNERWVWNTYNIIILADNCGCGVICHCGMSRGHCILTVDYTFNVSHPTPILKQSRSLCRPRPLQFLSNSHIHAVLYNSDLYVKPLIRFRLRSQNTWQWATLPQVFM